jgi:hypothetical protein
LAILRLVRQLLITISLVAGCPSGLWQRVGCLPGQPVSDDLLAALRNRSVASLLQVNRVRHQTYCSVVCKHPDLMVGPPTSTIIPTNDRNFEISQFLAKNFEKV